MRSSSSGWTEVPGSAGSVLDLDRASVLEAIHDQRQRTLALLRELPEPDWERIVVPRWRVREVAAHMITTDEGSLTGRILAVGFTKDSVGSIPKVEAWNDRQVSRWADRPIPELIRGLEKWGNRMERLARMIPARFARTRIPTPFGKLSPVYLAAFRAFDEWVHREDLRRTLGMPSDDEPAVIRPVARMLHAGIPVQSLPRVLPGASGRVALAFDDLELPDLGFDLGLRRYGYGVEGADARIAGRASALIMVAARRDPWQDAEAAGALKVDGDRASAEGLLEALLLV